MFLVRRGQVPHTFKHPVESVWYGIGPLVILCKITGFWTHVSFTKPNIGKPVLRNSCYIRRPWFGKETLYSASVLLIVLFICAVNIEGEQHNPHENTIFTSLAYITITTYLILHSLPRLLTIIASPKLVELFNNIAYFDCQLQVRPEDCWSIRRRSFISFVCLMIMAVINWCLSSVNFSWWRKAGQSDFVAYLCLSIAPTLSVTIVLLLLTFVEIMNTLAHRFQVITTKVVSTLELGKGHNKRAICTDLRESSTGLCQTLAAKLDDVRLKHEFLQENVELFHRVSGALVGCVIPIQIFLIITESFAIIHNKDFWRSQRRMSYIFAVILRTVAYAFSIVVTFRAGDNLKREITEISRAVPKRSLLHLQPEEQLQIQLLTSVACRNNANMNPAGYFTLSLAVIPSLVSNFATFFIIQFQTFMGTDINGQSCKNGTTFPDT